MKYPSCSAFWLGLVAAACAPPTSEKTFCPAGEDLAAQVDPFIGSQGSGNVVPGAQVPHGMVKLSPDSVVEPGSIDAYEWGSARLEGFSHTHLQGPGGSLNGYSHILLMPATGALRTASRDYASAFSHDSETAEPGYYAVTLDDYGVRAELSAAAHAGFHRYTFPASDSARVLFDLGHSRGDSRGGLAEFGADGKTLSGFGEYNVHPLVDMVLSRDDYVVGRSRVYFWAEFSRPSDSRGTWSGLDDDTVVSEGATRVEGPWVGAWAGFRTGPGEVIEVRIGISLVGVEQARRNLAQEIGARTFEDVRAEARSRWNCLLNRVRVEGGTAAQRRQFYTALYFSLASPTDYSEAGGAFFSGADGRGAVFEEPGFHFYSDDWCAWDTFRTSRPLATLVEPETVSDVVASYLHLYQQGGWLPKCPWHATGDPSVMIANHGVSIIADAYTKGLQGFDAGLAWEAVEKSATQENLDRLFEGVCGYANQGTPPEYVQNGFVSHECDAHQSASMTLEYAYDDWCIAQLAAALGKTEAERTFRQRAQNFRNQWNPATGFMQGRYRDGRFTANFDPADASDANDFCEATAWIYTWFVPHDVAGLIELMGGRQAFLDKLDRFFAEGHFDISNEPSFHVPFLYNLAGRPARAQETVRRVLAESFSARPDGLPGNDDSGATSAWLVLAAMGLYPLAPGDGGYQIVSPWFERIVLHPSSDVLFTIEAPGASEENRYIQEAFLDGAALHLPFVSHRQILSGHSLVLRMGAAPSAWGE